MIRARVGGDRNGYRSHGSNMFMACTGTSVCRKCRLPGSPPSVHELFAMTMRRSLVVDPIGSTRIGGAQWRAELVYQLCVAVPVPTNVISDGWMYHIATFTCSRQRCDLSKMCVNVSPLDTDLFIKWVCQACPKPRVQLATASRFTKFGLPGRFSSKET